MAEDQADSPNDWYKSERPLYEGLTNVVHYLVESLIRHAKIDYLSVTSRTKSNESFLEKIQRKEYVKPVEEITDFSGIRVITFIDSDVSKVCDLIKSSFNVHEAKSLDKLNELGIDRFGYRSVHFVCDLGAARTKLPEFSLYANRMFEIQVRTALQHAWAEIEHDRNYKFSGVLPTPIQRRLHLLAGVLEMVDREFVAVALDIDHYAKEVSEKTRSGDLDIEINTTSLQQYLPAKLQRFDSVIKKSRKNEQMLNQVIAELRAFGINTLADLDQLFSDEFISAMKAHVISTTLIGVVRKAMMYHDVNKYFSSAWKNHWREMTRSSLRMLKSKYGNESIERVLGEYKLNPQKTKKKKAKHLTTTATSTKILL